MTTDMSQQGNTPVWEVTSVEDTYGPTSFGGDNRIKRVNFRLLDGTKSYIDVPFADFTAAKVAAAIERHVQDMIDVLQLKGQSF